MKFNFNDKELINIEDLVRKIPYLHFKKKEYVAAKILGLVLKPELPDRGNAMQFALFVRICSFLNLFPFDCLECVC